ncbi:hypothetical protein [Luteibaculum oceani]|uniref:Uncharacterized protein n=1 Tax=Luteibaculum oceani TaxID=1294296 RepID=A0A5C6USK9_9FLAO|nr:hypothetical protein [Luteibaculum oceani]TXC75634.1 hypothetical protein FRX97_11695 [Luteibaculum oceani]
MKYAILLFTLLLGFNGFAQSDNPLDDIYELEARTADCLGAIKLGDKLGPVVGNNKIGFKYEIKKQEHRNPYIFAWEHNVVWFRFTPEKDGELELLISPIEPSENFDFILYVTDGRWFCNDFHEYVDSPIRSNLSTNPGTTGISSLGQEEFVTEDKSNAYSSPVQVKAGYTYYLVIDSPDGKNSGFSIEKRVK